MSEYLGDRRKALEESFFARQEKKLLNEVREQREKKEGLAALADACGVHEASVLDALLRAGIHPETLPALTLIPLVVVAWSEGSLEERERRAVLDAAEAQGVTKGDAPHALLEGWLSARPPANLFDTWLAYAAELREVLSEDERKPLRTDLVKLATAVADAAGGVLGLGPRISKEEKRLLKAIEEAL